MNSENIGLEQLLGKKDAKKMLSKVKFEEGMAVLEELVAKVESGNMPLDHSVDAYELAAELVRHLRTLLTEAEGKLKILQENSSGEITAKDSSQ